MKTYVIVPDLPPILGIISEILIPYIINANDEKLWMTGAINKTEHIIIEEEKVFLRSANIVKSP